MRDWKMRDCIGNRKRMERHVRHNLVMEQSDSDDNDDADDVPTDSSNVAPSAAVQPPDLCEVCLVEERDNSSLAFSVAPLLR